MSTTVFVECVSCGKEEELFDHDVHDVTASRAACKRGWTIRGYRRAKHTRCPSCRKYKRTDTEAVDRNKIGKRAGSLRMKVRHSR